MRTLMGPVYEKESIQINNCQYFSYNLVIEVMVQKKDSNIYATVFSETLDGVKRV